MIITVEIIKNFNPCRIPFEFEEKYPDGIDISPLWGTDEEAGELWKRMLDDDFLKAQVGWAISVGLLPARIRANLRGADLRGADLEGGKLWGADLRGADHDHYTIWPEGFAVE